MIDKDNLKYPWMSQFTINAHRCSCTGAFKPQLRRDIVEGIDLALKISSAFTWYVSPEGIGYWSYLADLCND